MLNIQHSENGPNFKLRILKKLQFMCEDSGRWTTVEKAFYFVIPAASTACHKLDLWPSLFAVFFLSSDIFLLACLEFDNRL